MGRLEYGSGKGRMTWEAVLDGFRFDFDAMVSMLLLLWSVLPSLTGVQISMQICGVSPYSLDGFVVSSFIVKIRRIVDWMASTGHTLYPLFNSSSSEFYSCSWE